MGELEWVGRSERGTPCHSTRPKARAHRASRASTHEGETTSNSASARWNGWDRDRRREGREEGAIVVVRHTASRGDPKRGRSERQRGRRSHTDRPRLGPQRVVVDGEVKEGKRGVALMDPMRRVMGEVGGSLAATRGGQAREGARIIQHPRLGLRPDKGKSRPTIQKTSPKTVLCPSFLSRNE